jgi:hypothetical protein
LSDDTKLWSAYEADTIYKFGGQPKSTNFDYFKNCDSLSSQIEETIFRCFKGSDLTFDRNVGFLNKADKIITEFLTEERILYLIEDYDYSPFEKDLNDFKTSAHMGFLKHAIEQRPNSEYDSAQRIWESAINLFKFFIFLREEAKANPNSFKHYGRLLIYSKRLEGLRLTMDLAVQQYKNEAKIGDIKDLVEYYSRCREMDESNDVQEGEDEE